MKHFVAMSTLLLAITVSMTGCDLASTTLPTRPASAQIDTVGMLATLEDYGDKVVYVLADGRRVERANDRTRTAYDLPGGNVMFLSGTDAEGAFVALIGAPQDAPPGCEHVVRYGLREWGDAIESQGLLWAKASGFESASAIPPIGAEYPSSSLLCLDDEARVTAVMELAPPASPGPPASVTAP